MAINKVIYGSVVLVDLTEDTVVSEKLAKGVIAHNAKGEIIIGEMVHEPLEFVTKDGNILPLENLSIITANGEDVYSILSGEEVLWERTETYTNQVPFSIDANGDIYNGGLGYKTGYRIRSGGAEAVQASATCTGFIAVNPDDVIRIAGCDFSIVSTGNAINISNSTFVNLGQMATNSGGGYGSIAGTEYASAPIEESEGVWKWIVPSEEYNVSYIRVTATNCSNLIVTVNEEIIV